MARIYWDTMIFAYRLDRSSPYYERVAEIFRAMQVRGDELYTSLFTRGELLVKPYRMDAFASAAVIRESIAPPNVSILPIDEPAMEQYARIRAANRVAPADAIHLATAAAAGMNLFLTNDRDLTRYRIEGIDFIAGLDTNLFQGVWG